MFFRKKKPEPILYEVSVFATQNVTEEEFDGWTDDVFEAVSNVISIEHAVLEEVLPEEIEDIRFRFPEIDVTRTFFLAERLTESLGSRDAAPQSYCTNELIGMLEFLKQAERAQKVT
ncbi:hypothetical protein NCCP2716_00400 [Sporosarcina sp. NCCP-2716]|uniref:hypothetical protein n=1 Tax=Sporosarcina sp. NCCP-2716 TaxID=2943679 RepID=UPI00204242A7|nr:hypothetical protein [Sporosarcina sp. NCCP-2716]GKV67542.1 hypothetical protein NCCP2716_00400 [Sporosarcina sp. NCCP-2716]